jgi:hypothetical protein
MIRVEDMHRHIERLLAPYTRTDIDDGIQVSWDRRVGRARVIRDLDGTVLEIQLAPIRSVVSYATALHELGHIWGRHQRSRSQAIRERWAWEWARRNALDWTPAMELCAVKALAGCALRERRRQA